MAGEHDPSQDSHLYGALARLSIQVVPPDTAGATEAANAALDLAQTPEDRHRAAYVEATVLQFGGRLEDARKAVRAMLEREQTATLPGLKLGIFEGSLAEQGGDAEAAEQAYRNVIRQTRAMEDGEQAQLSDSYRLATLKLARLYRRTGRSKEAERLVSEIQQFEAAVP